MRKLIWHNPHVPRRQFAAGYLRKSSRLAASCRTAIRRPRRLVPSQGCRERSGVVSRCGRLRGSGRVRSSRRGLQRFATCRGAGWRVVKAHRDLLVVAPVVLQCLTGQDGPVSRGERRLDDGPRPALPGEHDVGLGDVRGNLGGQVDPGEQSEHGGQYALDGIGVQEVAHEVGAERLAGACRLGAGPGEPLAGPVCRVPIHRRACLSAVVAFDVHAAGVCVLGLILRDALLHRRLPADQRRADPVHLA